MSSVQRAMPITVTNNPRWRGGADPGEDPPSPRSETMRDHDLPKIMPDAGPANRPAIRARLRALARAQRLSAAA